MFSDKLTEYQKPENGKYCAGQDKVQKRYISLIGENPYTQNIKAGNCPDKAGQKQ